MIWGSQKKGYARSEDIEELKTINLTFIRVRFITAIFVLLASLPFGILEKIEIKKYLPFLALFGTVILYNFIFYLLIKKIKWIKTSRLENLPLIQSILDTTIFVLFSYFAGISYSFAVLGYFIYLPVVSFFLRKKELIFIAVFLVSLHTIFFILSINGITPPFVIDQIPEAHRRNALALYLNLMLFLFAETFIFSITLDKFNALQEQRIELLRKLKDMALKVSCIDDLTGVYNRRFLTKEIKKITDYAKEKITPLTFVFLDIDNLKKINDTLGHLKGDEVLQKFGGVLKNSIREEDVVVRWGGDEFLLILKGLKTDEIKEVLKRVKENMAKITVENLDFRITCSIATHIYAGEDEKEILRKLDEMLYREKKKRFLKT